MYSVSKGAFGSRGKREPKQRRADYPQSKASIYQNLLLRFILRALCEIE